MVIHIHMVGWLSGRGMGGASINTSAWLDKLLCLVCMTITKSSKLPQPIHWAITWQMCANSHWHGGQQPSLTYIIAITSFILPVLHISSCTELHTLEVFSKECIHRFCKSPSLCSHTFTPSTRLYPKGKGSCIHVDIIGHSQCEDSLSANWRWWWGSQWGARGIIESLSLHFSY